MTQYTTAASGITAAELDTSTLPAEFVGRLINAANAVACLIGNGAIVPASDDDTVADEVATALTALMSEAWCLHSRPAIVDTAFVRRLHDERQAAEAAAASANGALDLDDDADAALVP